MYLYESTASLSLPAGTASVYLYEGTAALSLVTDLYLVAVS